MAYAASLRVKRGQTCWTTSAALVAIQELGQAGIQVRHSRLGRPMPTLALSSLIVPYRGTLLSTGVYPSDTSERTSLAHIDFYNTERIQLRTPREVLQRQ